MQLKSLCYLSKGIFLHHFPVLRINRKLVLLYQTLNGNLGESPLSFLEPLMFSGGTKLSFSLLLMETIS